MLTEHLHKTDSSPPSDIWEHFGPPLNSRQEQIRINEINTNHDTIAILLHVMSAAAERHNRPCGVLRFLVEMREE